MTTAILTLSLRISEFEGGINADMLSARVTDPQLFSCGSGDPQRPSENDNDSLKAPTTIPKNPNNHPHYSQQLLCPRGFAIPEAINADMLSARVKDPQLTRWGSEDPQRPSENDNDSPKPRRRFPRIPTTIPKIPNNYPKKGNDLEGQISK